MKFDILVYGPVFSDLIFSELDEKPMLGEEIFARDFVLTLGGSAIVAIGLHRLGAKVGLIANLGNDLVSRIAWELLGDFGLDRSLIRRLPHPLTQITVALSYPEDRAFITHYQRPDNPIDITEIIETQKANHIHLCSIGKSNYPASCPFNRCNRFDGSGLGYRFIQRSQPHEPDLGIRLLLTQSK